MRLAVIDGVVRAPEEATVSVYDRGFLYGDSVFETVRSYGGKLFALDEHLQRLERSAERVAIPLPLARAELGAEIERAVAQAANPECSVRLMLTRGSGPLGLAPTAQYRPLRVILVEPLSLPPAAWYRDGIAAVCVQTVRASDAAHSAKLGNYLASVLALREARHAGAEEALVVSREGRVVEGTTSNVFAVRSGELYTPPLGAGILEGITRAVVLELCASFGITVHEEALVPSELAACDELFLTSSVREIVPVVRVDGQKVGAGKPGDLTRRIHRAFRARVGLGDQAMPWADTMAG